jgi:hypothetical protein
MNMLIAVTETEQDGVNVLPFILAILVLGTAAVVMYVRRRRE